MSKNKMIALKEAVSHIKDDMTVMVGGFMTNGSPMKILAELAKSGVKNLTIICNDAHYPNIGIGALLNAGCIKAMIVSHIGLNPDVGARMLDGSLDVTLVPQGTMAERIRAGGAGLGGILTPTGVGTIVEEGKQKITVDGKEYLLELPLKADIALLSGYNVDSVGNIFYRGNSRNFNPMMATAADLVIVEADNIVEEIIPEHVHTPYIFVDYIVDGGAAK